MKFIHFSGLENNLNCSKKDNVILSWNLSNNYFKKYKRKEIFHVTEIWQKNKLKIKNKVLLLRKKTNAEDIWICFGLIKPRNIDFLVEKVSEIGVKKIKPMIIIISNNAN